MLDLHRPEVLKQALGLGCVVTVAIELGDPDFLIFNMSLAFGNVPLGLFEVTKSLIAVHER
jgi:hypothetical protein